jgi:hypothetical protein
LDGARASNIARYGVARPLAWLFKSCVVVKPLSETGEGTCGPTPAGGVPRPDHLVGPSGPYHKSLQLSISLDYLLQCNRHVRPCTSMLCYKLKSLIYPPWLAALRHAGTVMMLVNSKYVFMSFSAQLRRSHTVVIQVHIGDSISNTQMSKELRVSAIRVQTLKSTCIWLLR